MFSGYSKTILSKISFLSYLTSSKVKSSNYVKSFYRSLTNGSQINNYKNFNINNDNNNNNNISFPRQGLSNLKKGSLKNLCDFNGKIMILGFGTIGEGVLPLILRHINVSKENIFIVTASDRAKQAYEASKRFGISCEIINITKNNYKDFLKKSLKKGDFCLNLSVDISSVDVIEYCNNNNILYLDTVVEPWKGGYSDNNLSISERSNYYLRHNLLDLKSKLGPNSTTAVSCHGANPGMVSHLVKQGLLNIAKDIGHNLEQQPQSKQEWAKLAYELGIKVIHIAERDSQIVNIPKQRNEFINTWSIEGFVNEGCQPAELGWGTHEKSLPIDGEHHTYGNKSAIYIKQPGCITKVRSWVPTEGSYHGWLITHNESITLSDYFTYYDEQTNKIKYRPTCHYAYHPCDQAVLSLQEFINKNFTLQDNLRLIDGGQAHSLQGIDELGVLLCGHAKNAYWFGSQLNVADAREMVEYNQATSLQVTSSVLAGLIWAIKNPQKGIIECEEMDFKFILDIITPYISPIVGVYTDWNPTQNRGHLFPDDVDNSDPWQFYNIRVRELWQAHNNNLKAN